ncbi:tRNA dihydrouridine synthase [Xanthoria parietina]
MASNAQSEDREIFPSPKSMSSPAKRRKLTGRAFYESLGNPSYILAPMVDQSEFAWRLLSRSFLQPSQQSSLLAYTPMLHARLYKETQSYRDHHFQPVRTSFTSPSTQSEAYLDGNPINDRPLIVQFCANDPDDLLQAAKHVAPYCDAVDLNLGCPQGIARKGHYGSFLQESPNLIHSLVSTLANNLDIPVTAKMRVLDTREDTLRYARLLLDAGASWIAVHGRRREQKGHETGLADWTIIRYLRENLPKETVILANGNILGHEDLDQCLQKTGADGVMSAEGNLCDPGIFAGEEGRREGEKRGEYWVGKDGKGGWRMDAVLRRYLDILYRFVLGKDPPLRTPLFVPSKTGYNVQLDTSSPREPTPTTTPPPPIPQPAPHQYTIPSQQRPPRQPRRPTTPPQKTQTKPPRHTYHSPPTS